MFFIPLLAKAASFIGANLFPIAATGFSAYAQYQAGKAREQDLQYQAELLKRQAAAEELSAMQQAEQIKKNVERDISRSRAMFASRGIKLGRGSALSAQEISLNEQSEDIDTLMFGANQKISNLNNESTFTKLRGKSQKRISKLNTGMSLAQGLMSTDFGSFKSNNSN